VSMEWKDNEISRVLIKSTLGGNCRLRVPNELICSESKLKKPVGENDNPFYISDKVREPVISSEAKLRKPVIPETKLYDLQTEAGKTYELVNTDQK